MKKAATPKAKDSPANTSQDYDRKHGRNHIASNPRAIKDRLTSEDSEAEGDTNSGNALLIERGHTITEKPVLKAGFTEDKRKTARQEHTNHFTNRASNKK